MKKTTVLVLDRKEKIIFMLLIATVLAFLPYTAYASNYVNLNDLNYNEATGSNSANNQSNNTTNNTTNGTTNQYTPNIQNNQTNTNIQNNQTNTNIQSNQADDSNIQSNLDDFYIQNNQANSSNAEQPAESKPQIEVMSMDTYPKMGFYYDFQDVPGFSSYNRINNPQIRAYKLYEVNFFYLNGGFYSYKGAIYDYFNATDSQAENYIKLLKSLGFKSVQGFSGLTYFEEFAEQVVTEFQTDPFYDKKNQAILIKEDGDQFTWVLVSNSSGPTPESTTWENAKYAPCKEIRVYSLAPIDVDKTPIIELSAADIATVKAALAKDTALLKAIKNRTIDLTKIDLPKLSSILSRRSTNDVLHLLEQNKNITDFGSVIANSASESKPVTNTANTTPVTIDGQIIDNTIKQTANTGNVAQATPPMGAAAFAANVTNSVVTEKTGVSPNKTESVVSPAININNIQNNAPTPPTSTNTSPGGAQTLANNVTQSLQNSTTAYNENTLVPLISKSSKGADIGNGIKYVSMNGKLVTYEYVSSSAKTVASSYIELLTGSGFTKFVSGTDSVSFDINEFMMLSNGISEQDITLQNAQIYKKNGTIVYIQSTDTRVFVSFSVQ